MAVGAESDIFVERWWTSNGSSPIPGKVLVSPVKGALDGAPIVGVVEEVGTEGRPLAVKREEMI